LKIGGFAKNPYFMNYTELQELQHVEKLVTLQCVEGWTRKMLSEGIPLIDLIEKADPDDRVTNVIFKSTDGYTTTLTLDYIGERNIILADKLNGIKLPPAQGFPFIVVAKDKWGNKWARWVEEIELSDNDKYRGYWEEFGTAKTEASTNRCSTGRRELTLTAVCCVVRSTLTGYSLRPLI